MKPSLAVASRSSYVLLLVLGGAACASSPAGEQAPAAPEQGAPKPAGQEPAAMPGSAADLQGRLVELEKRIGILERALVQKDLALSELGQKFDALSKQVKEQGAGGALQEPLPGNRLTLTPEQLQDFQKRLDRYFERHLDDDFDLQAPPGPGNDLDDLWNWGGGQRRVRPKAPAKPRLGVLVSEPTPELRQRYRNTAKEGALVTQVFADSPADRGGFKPGDCIIRFDQAPIRSSKDLTEVLETLPAGRHTVVVLREGEERRLVVLIDEEPGRKAQDGETRQDEWVRRKEEPLGAQRATRFEIRTNALETSEVLTRAMGLNEKQRLRFEAVLGEQQGELNQQVGKLIQQQGEEKVGEEELRPLVAERVAEAERILKNDLSKDQLAIWREYRERQSKIQILRQVRAGQRSREEPESPQERSQDRERDRNKF